MFFIIFGRPVQGQSISNISPLSGNIGSAVTITGNNFSATPSSNLVRFGATQANVTAATITQLTVIVPTGATFGPVTVKVGNLIAYSAKFFLPSFPAVKPDITAADFAPKVDFTTGTNAESVVVADLDGDGKSEMLVANYTAGTVSVFRNTASSGSLSMASFASKVDFSMGTNPLDLVVQDLDGDGKLDLAVANSGGGSISVLRNTSTSGAISFSTKVDFNTASTPYYIDAGDIDGDGKTDLVVANYGSSSISVLRNISTVGSIIFNTKVDFATASNPQEVTIADVDGDGKVDVAVANYNSTSVSIFRNTAIAGTIDASSLAAKVDFTTGTQPISVAFADIDGDGKSDMAVTNDGNSTISVFRSTATPGSISSGTFAAKVDFATGTFPSSVRFTDLNGDGKADMVSSNVNSAQISVFRNTATTGIISAGSFATRVDIPMGAGAQYVAMGDLDGDGKPDLVVTNYNNSMVSVLRNNPILFPSISSFSPFAGNIGTAVTITGTNFSATPANNLVRFGATQATVTAATTTQLTVTVPSGATYAPITVKVSDRTTYSQNAFLPTFPAVKAEITAADFSPKVDFGTGSNPTNISIGDLDGDGKIDVIVPNSISNTISIFRNISTIGSVTSGSFATKVDFVTGTNPNAVAVGDLDGDGKMDLAVVNNGSNNVSVYRNTSSVGSITITSFSAKVDFPVGSQASYIAIGDLDGDGKPELVVSNYASNTISVLQNMSVSGSITSSSFAPIVNFASGNGPSGLIIRDLDGDNKLDIAVADHLNGSTVSVYLNIISSPGVINSASLAARVSFTTGSAPQVVEAGDIDGDGKPDLVVTNDNGLSVSILRNTATSGIINSGSFATKVDFVTGANPISVSLSDLDGDSKPDLAIANGNGGSVSILRNTATIGSITSGSFAPKVDLPTGATTYAVLAADIDSDGKADLVTSNYNGGMMSVLRNNPILFPTITSFSPLSGAAGITVTITGTNFSSTSANNVVRFGATQAMVTAATISQLTVIVPAGATFGAITVKVTDRTAYSSSSFLPTFLPVKADITPADFSPKVDFTTGTNTEAVSINDLDGDGKSDLVVVNYTAGSVSVFRNMAVNGAITASSFTVKTDYLVGIHPYDVAVQDLDGDGKLDIVVTNEGSASVSVLRNTSNTGSISFSNKVDFATGTTPIFLDISDIDGDGKSDIVVGNYGSANVSILQNKTTVGSITATSFASKVDFTTGSNPQEVTIGDLDGDGKPDLAVANYSSNTVSVLRNTATIGVISNTSFAGKVDFVTGTQPLSVAMGDVDGDGKLDLAVTNDGLASISVFRNTTTLGNINAASFAAKTDFITGPNPSCLRIGDLDGDGKPEMVSANVTGAGSVSIFRNTATMGSISATSFDGRDDLITGSNTLSVAIGDLDGDGKPDLAVTNYLNSTVSVLRNNPILFPTITSFTPVSGAVGTTVTITGTNFTSTPANNVVRLGATQATVTAATTTQLTVTVPAGATHHLITVKVVDRTAYSSKAFVPTFPAVKGDITAGDFMPKVDFATATNPTNLSIGDLDGDGKTDLIVPNGNSNSISIFRNTSTSGTITSSSFAAKVDFITGINPNAVAVGDLDGDGKPDLAVVNNGVNVVSVYRNTTSVGSITTASFAAKVDFPVGSQAFNYIAIGDVDGDGKPELVLSNYTSNTISVLQNTTVVGSITTSSFAAKVDFASGTGPSRLILRDLDGDNKLDVGVAEHGSGTVSIFRNTATIGVINTGSLSARVAFIVGSGAQFVEAGDIDGDGKTDLVVTNDNGFSVSILRNTATPGSITSGSFASKVDFTTGQNPISASLGDLDGDGKPDLAIASANGGSISIFRNTATSGIITTASFAAKVEVLTGASPYSVAVGDLDNDGKPDLISSNYSGNLISVFRSNPIPFPTITTFSPLFGPVGSTVLITGTNFSPVPANNLVRFGATQASVTAASTTQLTVTVPTGAMYAQLTVKVIDRTAFSANAFTPTFSPNKPIVTTVDILSKVDFTTGSAPQSVAPGDLDGDGKTDLVAGNYASHTISVFRNAAINGTISNGSFAVKVDFATGSNPRYVAIGDLDGDGKLDVAVTNYVSSTLSIFRNISSIGTISLAARIDLTTGANPFAVAIADIDGDGRPELVVTNYVDNSVSVFRNLSVPGTISFAAKVDFATGTNPVHLAVGDLDGDNKAEIITANLAPGLNTISVFKNTSAIGNISANSFASKVDIIVGARPRCVVLGDLDGDGKPDIAVSNQEGVNLSVLRNTFSGGGISFAPKVDFPTGESPQFLSIGDMNGDGKPDLVVANTANNSTGNSVSILRNTALSGNITSTSFAAKTDIATGINPISIALADIDGDGKTDISTANIFEGTGGNSISALRNNPSPLSIGTLPDTLCAGSTLNIGFTAYWNLSSGNVFTAQLSDANGSFTNPVTIGSLTGVSSGAIPATIPALTTYGSGYRVRIIASNPLFVSPVSSSNIFINTLPFSATSLTGNTTVLLGNTYTYSTPAITNAVTYQWTYSGTGVTITGTGTTVTVTYSLNASAGLLGVRGINTCGSGLTYNVPISLYPNPALLGFALVGDINGGASSSTPGDLTKVGSSIFFTATNSTTGRELYSTNGTSAGIVKDINSGANSAFQNSGNFLVDLNGKLVFAATESATGKELWKSDGTSGGTQMVSNAAAGAASSNPAYLRALNNNVYFNANVSAGTGNELYKSDGISTVTLVKDVCGGNCNGLDPAGAYPNINKVGNYLFFAGNDGVNGTEPWASDGNSQTYLLQELMAGSSNPAYFTELNGTTFFTATTGPYGNEILGATSLPNSAYLLFDANPGVSSSTPQNLVAGTGLTPQYDALYFTADDGVTGRELWISIFNSGTTVAAGVARVKDIRPGNLSSNLSNLAYFNGILFFSADDGVNGTELWISRGTDSTTVVLKDINCGAGSSNPSGFTFMNGWVYFSADDGVNGMELWRTDGTAGGTSLVGDLRLGTLGSAPTSLTILNNVLFFAADDGINGTELWKYNPATTNSVITGSSTIANLCPGDTLSVPYSITGTFNGGNIFTIQLSDNNGCFNNPINVGTKLSNTAGVINAIVPYNLAGGNQYRFRIVSSNPPSIPLTSPTKLTAKFYPSAATVIYGNEHVSGGQAGLTYSTPVITNANTYIWAYSGSGVTISGSGSSVNLSFGANATSGNLSCAGFNDCGLGQAATLPIYVANINITTAGRWDSITVFPTLNRDGAVAITINDKGYVGGGKTGSTYLNDFWEFDPLTGTWTQKANLGGGAREKAVAFSTGQRGFVGSGYNGSTGKDDFWEYNPTTNSWTQKDNIPGSGRWSAVGFSIANKGYVGSGNKGTLAAPVVSNDFYQYDPVANQWMPIANGIPIARAGAVAFAISNTGYVGTGYTGSSFLSDFYAFNPATQVWNLLSAFPGGARKDAFGVYMANRGYVGTGVQGTTYLRDFWEYNPATNAWTARQNIGEQGRSRAIAFAIKDQLWTGTGFDGTNTLGDFRNFSPSFINDEPQNAIRVPISTGTECEQSLLGSTSFATQTLTACSAGQFADDDVWFKFTATASVHVLRLFNFTSPLAFEIFSGTPGNLVSITCSPGAGNLFVMNNLTAGQQYYIRIYTIANSQYSDFSICIDSYPTMAVNDDCLSATILPVAASMSCTGTTYTTSQASQSMTACLVASTADDDVWFRFTATSAVQLVTVQEVTPIPAYANSGHLVLEIFQGNCAALSSLQCVEVTNSSLFTQILSGLTPGITYYLRAYSAGNTGYLSFKLCVSTPPVAPVNDLCTNANTVPVNAGYFCEQSVAGTTLGAGSAWTNNSCVGDDVFDEVWYSFTATWTSQVVSFDNVAVVFGQDLATNQLMGVQLYDNSCTAGGFLACGQVISDNKYLFDGLTPNTTYHLRVFTKQPGLYANFTICILTTPPVPPNDLCNGAYALPVNEGLICKDFLAGTNYYATYTPVAGACGSSRSDVWYTFTATQAAYVLTLGNLRGTEKGLPTQALNLQLFTGNCGTLQSVLCQTDSVFFLSNLTIGSTYYVRVSLPLSADIQEDFVNFDICLSKVPMAPANDECADAVQLSVSNQAFCTSAVDGSTSGASRSLADCNGGVADDDVWYRFNATGSEQVVSVYGLGQIKGSGTIWFEVYSGINCGSLVSLGCYPAGILRLNGLSTGSNYLVRVFTASASSYQHFRICISTPPSNDVCNSAVQLVLNNTTQGCQNPTELGSTLGADLSSGDNCNLQAARDVWYHFTATAVKHIISVYDVEREIVGENGSNTLQFAVFTGDCAQLVAVGCQQSGNVLEVDNLLVGQSCWIKVFSPADKGYSFKICVSQVPAIQSNNNCLTAQVLAIDGTGSCANAVTGSTYTTVAASSAIEDGCTYAGVNIDGVTWYKFTATGNLHSIKVLDVQGQSGSAAPIYHQVFSGNCVTGLQTLNCLSDVDSSRYDNLVAGQTYFIKLGKLQSFSALATFKLCVSVPTGTAINNTCVGSSLLAVNGPWMSGNTLYGTQSMPGCASDNSANEDLWYQFVATGTKHRVEVTDIVPLGGSSVKMIREIFTGSSCGSLSSLYCSEEDFVAEGLLPGVTYYVRTYTKGDRIPASYKIRISSVGLPPVNDPCTGAFILPANPGLTYINTVSGNTGEATQSTPPCLGLEAKDVWYQFTATGTSISLKITPEAGYSHSSDIVHEVFTGGCTNLSSISGCLEGTYSLLSDLSPGATYYVRVYEKTGRAPFQFTIGLIQYPGIPANDNCAASFSVPVNAGSTCATVFRGTNVGATASVAGDCFGSMFCDDVFYKFTATATTHIISLQNITALTTTTSADSLGFIVYGSCLSGPKNGLTQKAILTGLTIGTNYTIRVGSKGPGGEYNYDICITKPPVPANDDCGTAQQILANAGSACVNAYNGTTLMATNGPASCLGGVAKDVWYRFLATSTTHQINLSGLNAGIGNGFNLVHQVYMGNCPSPTALSCSEADTSLITGLTIGLDYYIRVYSQDSASAGSFNICITTPSAVPVNDNCSQALSVPVNVNTSCSQFVTGFTYGASQSLAGCNGSADDDIWFKFTALSTAQDISIYDKQLFGVNSSNQSLILEVYSDSCAANPNTLVCTTAEQATLSNLLPGHTYFLRIYTAAASGAAMFKICIKTLYLRDPPVNDHLSGAISLVQQQEAQCSQGYRSWGSFYYATAETANACKGGAAYDVWYKFVALGPVVSVEVAGRTNLVAEVWLNGPLQLRNCIDSTSSPNGEAITLTNLQAGATYYLRVYPYASSVVAPPSVYHVENSTFSICVYGDTIAPVLLQSSTINPFLTQNIASGYTPGNFSSTETGAAIYSIPLAIPSGTGGMQPDVSLVYNSQGGNGLMGVGWSLTGFSVISRSAKTIAQDGQKRGIDYSATDRYVLDGEKLVNISTQNYGTDGCEYRTEQQSFKRVISYGSVNGTGTPERFKVWTKDGLLYEYGYTEDSKIEVQGRHEMLYWLVNRITDTKGNYIRFYYEEDAVNGTYYPSRIEYTGNDQTGLAPYCHVEFGYEARSDVGESFRYGSLTKARKRLNKITAWYENQQARTYTLSYQEGVYDQVSMLIGVQECGLDGKCFSPTTFQWQNGDLFFAKQPNVISNMFPIEILGNNNALFREMDFNGDGLVDLFTYDYTTQQSKLYKNDGNYNFSDSTKMGILTLAANEVFDLVDFNSDGFTDFYIQDTVSGNTRWLAHNRSLSFAGLGYIQSTNKIPAGVLAKTVAQGVKQVQFLDLNGDGTSDALIRSQKDSAYLAIYLNTNTGAFTTNTGTIPALLLAGSYELVDYDADGLTDVLKINPVTRENWWYHNESTQTPQAVSFVLKRTNALAPGTLPLHPVFKMGDWNGDGVTDLAIYGAQTTGANTTYSEIQWYINKGNLFFKTLPNALSPSIAGSYGSGDLFFVPYDMNGDGKDDVLNYRSNTGELSIYLNDGMGKFSNSFAGTSLTNLINPQLIKGGAGIRPVTYRHGNVFSLLWWNPTNGQNRVIDLQLDFNYGRVDKITNGLGQVVAIRYDELTKDSIYQRSNTALYPEHDFFGGYKVVSEYCINDPGGDSTRVLNRFKRGKMNLQGRGFRGYEEVETIDATKGIRSCSVRDADTRYLSAPVKLSQIFQPNGKLLNETEQINVIDSIVNPAFPSEKVYWSYSKEIIQRNYELSGQLISIIRKRQQINMNGNTLYSVVDYGGGIKDSTTFIYTDDITKWFLGRLTRSKIYRILPGKPTSIRTVAFEYDAVTGLKTKEILEPDSTETIRISKQYYFDAYGNITRSATTAWNGTVAATRSSYSSYDPKGRFSIQTHNDLGQGSNFVYHPILGLPISETDPNGLTKSYLYDGFGRVLQETQPDGNWVKYRYYKCATGNCPENALYYILQEYSVGTPDKVYFDLLNRPVVKEDIGFSGTPTFQVTRYDKRGQVEQSSDPYYLNEPVLWTTYAYDLLDRPTQVTSPGGILSKVEYDGLTTNYINPLGQRKTENISADGRLLSVTDNAGKSITYDYDALRNMTQLTDSKGNHIQFEYDYHNYKTKMTDPDMGVYQYQYDRFGEILKQTYPDGQVVTMAYDTLGRLLKRTEPEGAATWKYDTKPHGIGMLDSIAYGTFSQAVYYDALSRVKTDRRRINGQVYDYAYDYDSLGRMSQLHYPLGFSIKNVYNEQNMLSEIRNGSTGQLYYRVDELNSYGQPLQTTYGNEVVTKYDFDPQKRWIRGIYAAKGSTVIQNLSYTYDDLANVRSKTNQRLGYTESCDYDNLNRLTKYAIASVSSTEVQYDELGNITYKSDVGAYHYGENGQGPHQLSRIEGNANVCIPSVKTQFFYTSYNMVKEMKNDSMRLTIDYGANRERTDQKIYKKGVLQEEKIYAGQGLEIVTDSTGVKIMYYVRGFDGVLMVHNVKNDTLGYDQYWHRDNQDNLQAVSSSTGTLLEELNYDPWGKRRNVDGSVSDTVISTLYARGYTGHEHYDFLGLINMNGRVQDPVLGRFVSADPYIQDMTNLQNLNRYSYVLNNPMSITDPSGFWGLKSFVKAVVKPVKQVAKAVAKPVGQVLTKVEKVTGVNLRDPVSVVLAVASVYTGGLTLVFNKQITKSVNDVGSKAFGESDWNTIKVVATVIAVSVATAGIGTLASGALVGFTGAYVGTGVNGASYEDAFAAGLYGAAKGAATAYLTNQVKNIAEGNFSDGIIREAVRSTGHGIVQGAINEADGGKFEHGFISGSLTGSSESVSSYFSDNMPMGLAFGAAVGGVGAKLGGGKFENGAISGIMVYSYNHYGKNLVKYMKKGINDVLDPGDRDDFEDPIGLKMGNYVNDNYFRPWFENEFIPWLNSPYVPTPAEPTFPGGPTPVPGPSPTKFQDKH